MIKENLDLTYQDKTEEYRYLTNNDEMIISTLPLDYTVINTQYESRDKSMGDVTKYFKEVIQDFSRIEIDHSILSGMPRIKDTRIPIDLIIACIKDGMSLEEIKEDYAIKSKDIEEALNFVIEILNRPYMEGK